MPATKTKSGLADFNLNSILVIIAGAVIAWLVNNGLSTAKDTKTSVTRIETSLPFITKSQERVEGDVKQIKDEQKGLITRPELDNKHRALQEAIKDVKGDVKDVILEQKRLSDEVTKRKVLPNDE